MSGIDRKSGVDLGLSVGGDWSRYQSGCSILQATSLGGRCIQVGLQGGSGIPIVFPVLLYYPELSLTHVHSLETAVTKLETDRNSVSVSVSAESASGFGAK